MVIRIRNGRAVLSLEESDRLELPIDLKLRMISWLLADVLDQLGTKEIEIELPGERER